MKHLNTSFEGYQTVTRSSGQSWAPNTIGALYVTMYASGDAVAITADGPRAIAQVGSMRERVAAYVKSASVI